MQVCDKRVFVRLWHVDLFTQVNHAWPVRESVIPKGCVLTLLCLCVAIRLFALITASDLNMQHEQTKLMTTFWSRIYIWNWHIWHLNNWKILVSTILADVLTLKHYMKKILHLIWSYGRIPIHLNENRVNVKCRGPKICKKKGAAFQEQLYLARFFRHS